MATNKTHLGRTVDLGVVTGVTPEGKDIIKKLRFKNIKNDATDDSVMGFAGDMEKVLVSTLDEVLLNENYALTIV